MITILDGKDAAISIVEGLKAAELSDDERDWIIEFFDTAPSGSPNDILYNFWKKVEGWIKDWTS